jgi:hypothetical protein
MVRLPAESPAKAPVDWKSDALPFDPACSVSGFCFIISVTSLGPNTGNDDNENHDYNDDDDFSAFPVLGVLLFRLQPVNEIKFLPLSIRNPCHDTN